MKIILVSGVRHSTYLSYILKQTPVNSKTPLSLNSLKGYINEYGSLFDIALITDGGLLSNPLDNMRIMQELFEEGYFDGIKILTVSHDKHTIELFDKFDAMSKCFSTYLRPTENEILPAFKSLAKTNIQPGGRKPLKTEDEYEKKPDDTGNRKRPIIPIIKPNIIGSESDEGESSFISRAHSRAIAFTGRAGAGVTGTVINIAYCAAKKGLRVILIDLDIEYRTVNLYINKFCTMAEESEDISRSLIRTLANPDNYTETAVSVSENLWVAGLGYDFADSKSLGNFLTEQRVSALVSALKNRFDYVLVDMPLRILSRFSSVMMHFDAIALCIENNLHASVTTLRTLMNDFKPEDIRYLNIKSKLIVTKYNDESMFDDEILSPERLAEIITDDMCDDFTRELEIAGEVPYTVDFDRQIENDIPIYETNALLNKAYSKILSRL